MAGQEEKYIKFRKYLESQLNTLVELTPMELKLLVELKVDRLITETEYDFLQNEKDKFKWTEKLYTAFVRQLDKLGVVISILEKYSEPAASILKEFPGYTSKHGPSAGVPSIGASSVVVTSIVNQEEDEESPKSKAGQQLLADFLSYLPKFEKLYTYDAPRHVFRPCIRLLYDGTQEADEFAKCLHQLGVLTTPQMKKIKTMPLESDKNEFIYDVICKRNSISKWVRALEDSENLAFIKIITQALRKHHGV